MNKMTPKDFFIHIGIIATLYASSVGLIALLFQIINVAFPDILYGGYSGYGDQYSEGIRQSVAALIIIFPILILLSWLLERDYVANPEKRELGIKRWLTFLTLFITGAAIATDLVVLIDSFLGGEISLRFVLKVLVVLFVAGFIFCYYLWDLRRPVGKSARPRIFAIIAGGLTIISIAGGFMVMGSPTTQRLGQFDVAKVNDLQNIQWQIVNYWQQKQILPSGLVELNDPISGFIAPRDRQTDNDYEYRKISNLSFELCAVFNLKNNEGNFRRPNETVMESPKFAPDNWQHDIGRVCFERTIDKELYPPYSNKR